MTTSGEQYILRMIVDVKNDQALQQLTKDIKTSGTALATTNRNMATSAKGSRQLGFAFQSAGYQVTDFVVQVEGGVSATRALSQQLPQLLAGFNILSPAFALTTAGLATLSALLPTIVRQFQKMGDATPELADFVKTADDNVTALGQSLREFDATKYVAAMNEGSAATRAFNEALLGGNLRFAQDSIREATNSLVQEFEEIRRLTQSQSGTATLITPFSGGASQSQLEDQRALIAELQASNLAEVFGSQFRAFEQLFGQLSGGEVDLDTFTSRFIDLFDATDSVNPKLRELATTVKDLREATSEISGVGGLGSSLDAFLDEMADLGTRIDAAQRGANAIPDIFAQIEGLAGAAPSGAAGRIAENDYIQTLREVEEARQKWVDSLQDDPAARLLEREREQLVQLAQAYQTSLLPASEQYRLELEKLATDIERLNLSEEVSAALTARIADKYRRQAEGVREVQYELTVTEELAVNAFQSFDQNFKSFVDGIARGTAETKDLFKNMAASIIGDLLRLYLVQQLTGFFFGGGGVRGSQSDIVTNLDPSAFAKGGVFNNGVQMFARGGVVSNPTLFPMSRGMGMMGEAGAEAIIPLGRNANGELGVKSPPVNVTVNNLVPGVAVETTQTDQGLTIELVREAIASDIARGGNAVANSIANSYGIQRRGI